MEVLSEIDLQEVPDELFPAGDIVNLSPLGKTLSVVTGV